MDDAAAFDALTGLIYDSVMDEDAWAAALRSLASFTGGIATGHVVANPSAGTVTECLTVDMDPAFTPKYLGYYADKEIRLPPAARFAAGVVMTESMLVDRRSLERSEIFNDLLVPYECPHFMLAWLQKSGHRVETVAVENSLRRGPLSDASVERFQRVLPHLMRAARMRDEFIVLREAQVALADAVESLPIGVVLLDDTGRAMEVNPFARRLLRTASGFGFSTGRLRAPYPADDAVLSAAIAAATRAAAVGHAESRTLAIRRTGGGTAIAATILGLGRSARISLAPRPSALLMLVDPDQKPPADAVLFRSLFGLTPAEAALAAALFEFDSLSEAAHKLGRSVATSRTQLKTIYAKTGCNSRSSLLRKLSMGVLATRPAVTASDAP